MSIYLHDIPLPEARACLQRALEEAGLWGVLGVETIPLDEKALGRVLADPVWAKVSSPHYHASAMDGFAVHAEESSSAQPSHPVTLNLIDGSSPLQAVYVDTGDAMPQGFNAVIPIENVESLDSTGNIPSDLRHPRSIRIRAAVTPWSHVRPLGEDIIATQLVLPAGQVLRPVDLGAIAASGNPQIKVARKPRVAILPTGTELVPVGSLLAPGDIIEYNSLVLAAQVSAWGGVPKRYPVTPDDLNAIIARVQQAAAENDLILLNAGSSAGSEDFSVRVVEKLGRLLFHGVAVRPGHPVIAGIVSAGDPPTSGELPSQPLVPVIGVPGYPVSAALTGDIFVEPLLARWLGRRSVDYPILIAQLTRKVVSPSGDDEYLRVAVGKVGERLLAAPLARGAGVITSLVRADGMVILPRGVQGAEAGHSVQVHLFRTQAELERTIFCIGSHDMTLDLLAQHLSGRSRRLVSANVGSLGGLIALKRGEAHLAGSHLLDPQSGDYNLSYIRTYLAGVPVRVYGFVARQQGLMVRKTNPKGLHTLSDLACSGVQFVNRQRGAGTRVLLDYHLNLLGISVEAVSGYNQEEYTHLGVAAAVASGRADCGLGIPAAAQSLGLDFVPLYNEAYQLVIPKVHMDNGLLEPLFEVLKDDSFKREVAAMPGYDVKEMGNLVAEVGNV